MTAIATRCNLCRKRQARHLYLMPTTRAGPSLFTRIVCDECEPRLLTGVNKEAT